MTPRHRLTMAICGVALLAAALPALAQPPAPGPHGPHGRHDGGPGWMDGHRFEHLAERLDLSEGQRDELRQALEAGAEEGREARRGLFEARRALGEQIHADVFDETAIREAAASVAAFEADLAVERAQRAQEMRRILTPEQLAQLEEMREARRDFGRHGRRGRGFRGPRDFGGPPPAGD